MKCSVELESAILQRVTGLKKTAKMWGSPEELEAVAMHFTHVVLSARTAAWSFEKTFEHWKTHGSPFAGDADEHAAMRSKMWATQEEQARVQVVQGFVVVWAGLERRGGPTGFQVHADHSRKPRTAPEPGRGGDCDGPCKGDDGDPLPGA